uniref:protein-tyrosine-phosphatase n=1 Tax=Alexandrium monilatum TaxID=311494 RepID=A0A7S4R4X2_9DINO
MGSERRSRLSDLVAGERAAGAGNPAGRPAPPLLAWARGAPRRSGAMVQVIPGLLLGNKQAAADREWLRKEGVVGVCAVGARRVFNDGLVYHHVSIEDDGSESMLPHFGAACDFIQEHRSRGAVLVHCKGGISRSPTMIIAYLVRHQRLSLPDAMEVCSLARPAARPREIFLRDLEHLESALREQASEADERCLWEQAVDFASDEAVARFEDGRQVASRQEVQAECRRLLLALESWCVQEAFGEPREASPALREAARAAVVRHARARGWTRL